MTAGVEPPAKAMPMAAPPAGMPRGPASSTDGVPVKAMPPVPVLPAPPAATTATAVEVPHFLVTKSALHPPLPESVAIINVPEAAEMVNLAPIWKNCSAGIGVKTAQKECFVSFRRLGRCNFVVHVAKEGKKKTLWAKDFVQ